MEGSNKASTSHGNWISTETSDLVADYLRDLGWMTATESIERMEPAGDGNMNCTLRVAVADRTVIVKQARPWVEKYPTIAAPVERADFERQFYEAVSADKELSSRMPKLLGAIPEKHLLVLEDLGDSRDASYLYGSARASDSLPDFLNPLLTWLSRLHSVTHVDTRDSASAKCHENRRLRQLNHTHMFEIPFQSKPAIDLDAITPGLTKVAAQVAGNARLLNECKKRGERYLEDGPSLLHGDFFPGSWLLLESGPMVIDPEFSFYGPPEFDLAVCVAHLRLIGYSTATCLEVINPMRSSQVAYETSWVRKWAGVEILRRLLGVAQLPGEWTLDQKQTLVDDAMSLVLSDVT